MPARFLELTAPSPPRSICPSPCCSPARNAVLPNPLLDLLTNSLILHQTAPYLTVSSLFALARTSRRFHGLIFSSTEAFRHLNLSTVSSADSAPDDATPIDIGGRSWRAERMDESLTEAEFYSGPLLGIFGRLASPRNNNVLATVSTMVLDGLTVPADLVREIVAEDRFRVRILSIRGVKHLNERKLRQVLRYAVRPGRPEGTPRLKGLYIFGAKDASAPPPPRQRVDSAQAGVSGGVTRASGAQLGASWNARSAAALHDSGDKWYAGAGRVLKKSSRTPNEWAEWAELLLACEGIIAFDGVLCRGPRHDVSNLNSTIPEEGGAIQTQDYMPPAIASVSLKGCEGCAGCIEGAAVFGDSKRTPLLAPVPLFASTVRACRIPPSAVDGTNLSFTTPFIARCEECLRSRWCERCNVWWCEQCYTPPASQASSQWQDNQSRPNDSTEVWIGQGREDANGKKRQMGSKKSCFGCGQTCPKCTAYYSKTCKICRTGYCLVDNEGSTLERCDWCNSGARRTRNLH